MAGLSPTILIAEDIAEYRSYLCGLLHEFGYERVLEAGDGREALRLLATHDVDLVISDFAMKPLSGLDLLRTAREHLRFENLPFIMITAVGDESTISQAERHGVSAYLQKPLHIEALAGVVRDVLGGRAYASLQEKYGHLRKVS